MWALVGEKITIRERERKGVRRGVAKREEMCRRH